MNDYASRLSVVVIDVIDTMEKVVHHYKNLSEESNVKATYYLVELNGLEKKSRESKSKITKCRYYLERQWITWRMKKQVNRRENFRWMIRERCLRLTNALKMGSYRDAVIFIDLITNIFEKEKDYAGKRISMGLGYPDLVNMLTYFRLQKNELERLIQLTNQ